MKKSGFSLIEVVLSLGVLSLIIYALLPLFTIIYRQVDNHYRQEAVIQCARDVVETRLSGQSPKDSYQVRGENYQLKERVLDKKTGLVLYQWTLKGEKDERQWQCYIPEEGIYTP
ncbi:Tfp pilus assembly protein PilV [Urinicoccus massiliensis]|uniref:Tfp pilus assembly protein PilV n=1 Tax=Urinicoccus massiliensis TaxID=1723382 RepID=A0A8H2M725_9FIRM|nr:prepilin-type N-terminal cleavage/methylation domain-containing protein [Urinicoccus massiliensis]KGF09801.1 hypothetical protein HMPREF1633_11970 [Tissierellia bacterium S5-A11]VFB16458.1 Tfp pilus assembly protein PilV [Urinicoccus massiliensis]